MNQSHIDAARQALERLAKHIDEPSVQDGLDLAAIGDVIGGCLIDREKIPDEIASASRILQLAATVEAIATRTEPGADQTGLREAATELRRLGRYVRLRTGHLPAPTQPPPPGEVDTSEAEPAAEQNPAPE